MTEPLPAKHFATRLVGRQITAVGRRGKFVVLDLDGGESLIVSLRMTGQLLFRELASIEDRFVRAFMTFEDGTLLRFAAYAVRTEPEQVADQLRRALRP